MIDLNQALAHRRRARRKYPMLHAYVQLVVSFVLSLAGAALGAWMESPNLMVLGAIPGLIAILGLCLIHGRK